MKKNKGLVPEKGITNDLLASKLKKILREKEWTPVMLAKKMDEPLPYIQEVLKGRRCIQLRTLIRFAKVLNVPVLEFSDCIKAENI